MTPTTPAKPESQSRTVWFTAGHLLLLTILGLLYARVPLSPDQFAIQYVAWRVNLGEPLYTGVIDMNWPGIVMLMRPIASLPFDPWFPWRAVDFLVMLVGVSATTPWLRRCFGTIAATIWYLAYPLLYTSPALYWFAGQPDAVMMHVVLLAVALHLCTVRRTGPALAVSACGVGIAMGLATLIKPTAICFAFALFGHAACVTGFRRNLAAYTACAVAGGFITLTLAFLATFLKGTQPADALLAAWTYNRTAQFVGTVNFATLISDAVRWLVSYWHLGLPFIALATLRRERPLRTSPRALSLLALLLLAGLGSYAMQSKGFAYHLAPVWTLLALLFCIGCSVASQYARHWKSQTLFLGAFVLIAYFFTLKATQLLPPVLAWIGQQGQTEPFTKIQAGDQITYATLQDINETLTPLLAKTPADAPLLVWGEGVVLNLQQRRPQPTPYYYFLSLTNLQPNMPMHDAWLQRFADELQRSPQAQIAVISNEAISLAQRSGNASHALIQHWIDQADIVAEFGNVRVMKRRTHPAPARGADPVGEDAAP